MDRKEKIFEFMSQKEYLPLTFEELAAVLCVPAEDTNEFLSLLNELEMTGKIFLSKKKRYDTCKKLHLITAKIAGSPKGFAFAISEDSDDIFIPESSLGGALDEDTVLVRITQKFYGEKRDEGEVVKILKHANSTVVGLYKQERNYGIVVADNPKFSKDIFISNQDSNGAMNNQKVVVKITNFASNHQRLQGQISEVLGFPNDFGVDILSVIKQYGFNIEFPPAVLDEAKNVPDSISEDDLKGRLDLRGKKIITIDGKDAKDLDDAVSLEKIDDFYRLGVHIADVSHYVKEDSLLDKEAFERATSVYLVDRVIPMLPVRLSNGICSLNERSDRLTMSVFMDVDKEGHLLNYEIFNSVISSSERMTYDDVRDMIIHKTPSLMERYSHIAQMIDDMYDLSIILKNAAKKRGSIDFNIGEAKIILDEESKAVDVIPRERSCADEIIEQFMLLCNQTVAKHMAYSNQPCIYRVHEAPSESKLSTLKKFVHNLGFRLNGGAFSNKSLQMLMDDLKGSPEEKIVSTIALRCMMKAKYYPENLGHYGIAASHYCHFTSPIRRYSDLVCHRSLKALLKGEGADSIEKKALYISQQCSDQELAAERAERDSEDIKKAEYMKNHIGESFEGTISSITPFGFFVMLPNTIEGLVRLENIKSDYYTYNERDLSLHAKRSGKIFRIGDTVKITVLDANPTLRQIDFTLGGFKNGFNKANSSKQKSSSRLLHRRKVRGGNSSVRNRSKVHKTRQG